MEISARKEQFSIAYIEAIAARLGLNPSVDRVDLRLSADNFNITGRIVRNPQIEIQLKCSSQDIEKDGSLKFKLPIKNYANKIRHPLFILCGNNSSAVLSDDNCGKNKPGNHSQIGMATPIIHHAKTRLTI